MRPPKPDVSVKSGERRGKSLATIYLNARRNAMSIIRTLLLLSAASFFGILSAAGARAQVFLPPPFVEYTAKFTCGTESVDEPDDVVAGVYASSINIHNPQARIPVRFLKKIVPAPREGTAGQPVFSQLFNLGPDQADRVDCTFIRRAGKLTLPYVEGFVVLEVPPIAVFGVFQPVLDAVAKYTARPGTTGVGVTTQAVVPIVGVSITH
jgi:hypothetical protein